MAFFRRQPRSGPTTEVSLISSSSDKPSTSKGDDDSMDLMKNDPPASLMTLPPEIHLAISKYLIYPDALSLKHTNRNFYNIVDTSCELKVAWLIERRSLHLECPNDRKCDLGSDLRFCRGSVP